MPITAFLKLKGQTMGDIKGNITVAAHLNQIAITAVSHNVSMSYDPTTGAPVTPRQHEPIMLTKEIDKSSPLLQAAFVNGENMTQFALSFFSVSAAGAETSLYRIDLLNAKILSINLQLDNHTSPTPTKAPLYETISFTYSKITWTFISGGITAMDNWDGA